jgi:glucose-6-phosphate 1-dehydrogenase
VHRASDPEAADAYEQLLGDAVRGESFRFAREDYVEEAWRIVDPVLRAGTPIHPYEPGTWGPPQASELAGAAGWRDPDPSR